MDPAGTTDDSGHDAPVIAVDQDQQQISVSWLGQVAANSTKHQPTSSTAEEDWQLVSPNDSPRGSRNSRPQSSRASFEVATHSDHASVCSDNGAQNEALADSVLSQPMDSPAQPDAATDTASAGSPSHPDSLDALRNLSQLSQEGSIDGYSDEESLSAAPQEAEAGANDDSSPPVHRLTRMADAFVKQLAAVQAGVGSKLAEASEQLDKELSIITKWMVDSMAAVVQGARAGGQAITLTLAAAMDRLHELLPKKDGKGDHKEVAWGVLGLAAGCVVAAATAVVAVYKNYKLGRDLHSRDRELAKLVMRVVSLQEILNNHRHMPITRYTSYGFAHTLL